MNIMNQDRGIPKIGKGMDACLNILLEEIQQAVIWSRPSILIAVHQSKNDQAHAIAAMEHKLGKISMRTMSIMPEGESLSVLDGIIRELDFQESIFFVHGLGGRTQIYYGLNMDRELIVEHRIKLIFWLTVEEMILLSQRAPDFWAFRHRVIEFPTGRSSRKHNLPSGVLLWHLEDSALNLDVIREKTAFQERLLQNIPPQSGVIANHAQMVGNLTYYYWLAGENQKATALLHQEIKQIELFDLRDMHSMLLNVCAINCFDQSNYQDALRWIEQALELSPDQSLLWSNHGIICRSAGQARKSLSSLKKAVKLNPSSFGSWSVLGYVHMSLGKYASALPYFEKALTLRPESFHFYPAMAFCHSQVGGVDKYGAIMQQLSDVARDKDYLSICRDGLLGSVSDALARLKELVLEEKIPQVFIRRDPNLHFIFGASVLRGLL